jgi:hypothetical protein
MTTQAMPSWDDEMRRQIKATESAQALIADHERTIRAQRAQLDDAHHALDAAGIPLEPHEPHDGCPTQLGHRVRALAALATPCLCCAATGCTQAGCGCGREYTNV